MPKVTIGKIVNTCGLKGEVKVLNVSDFKEERYKKGKIIHVYNKEQNIDRDYKISNYREKDKFIYLKLESVNSIEEAEALKNSLLFINSEDLLKDNNDLFYHYELLNMEVYYGNKKIGYISEVSDNGVQDLIRVSDDDKSFLVPFLDEFIESINVEDKKIVLKNLEGLV